MFKDTPYIVTNFYLLFSISIGVNVNVVTLEPRETDNINRNTFWLADCYANQVWDTLEKLISSTEL